MLAIRNMAQGWRGAALALPIVVAGLWALVAGVGAQAPAPAPAPAPTSTTLSNDFGELTVETNGNTIELEFEPSAEVDCDKIVFAQTLHLVFLDADGNEMEFQPGDYFDGWKYRDDDAGSDGTHIDHLSTEADPYYNGDDVPEDSGTQGHNNESGSQNATMSDSPSTNGHWPPGKTKARWEFETCVMCAAGDQAGTVYGCITWELNEMQGMEPGTVNVTSGADLQSPSTGWQEAMDRFDENHINEDGDRYCPD